MRKSFRLFFRGAKLRTFYILTKLFLLKFQEIVHFSCVRARDPHLLETRLAFLLTIFCNSAVFQAQTALVKTQEGTAIIRQDYAANLQNSFYPCNYVAPFFADFSVFSRKRTQKDPNRPSHPKGQRVSCDANTIRNLCVPRPWPQCRRRCQSRASFRLRSRNKP